MQKRHLGDRLKVTALGYGCMGLSHGYGAAIPKREAVRCIHSALDCGYDFIDTASVYVGEYADGSIAINEEIIGEAVKGVREKVVIASKGGIAIGNNHQILPDGSPKAFRKSLEESLKRLNIETIDLYYQHRMDPAVEPETVASLMADFIREGKIRFWGISNGSEEYIRRANAVCRVTCVQMRYSMMARWNEKIFPLLEELGIGFVAFSPLANGFLSAVSPGRSFDKKLDYRSRMPQYTEGGREKAQELIGLIKRLAFEKKRNACATFPRLDSCQKALDCSHSRHI